MLDASIYGVMYMLRRPNAFFPRRPSFRHIYFRDALSLQGGVSTTTMQMDTDGWELAPISPPRSSVARNGWKPTIEVPRVLGRSAAVDILLSREQETVRRVAKWLW